MQRVLTCGTQLPGSGGEWQTKRLGEIASFSKGRGLVKTDLSLDGRQRCVHYGELFTVYGERITEVFHGTHREGEFVYSIRNDVLMPTSDVTPSGLATASCILIPDTIIGGDILVIRAPEDVLNGEFLAYAIKTRRNQVMQLVSGTTVFHLYGRDMANFCFAVPSVDEQRAIAAVLSDVDELIGSLEALIAKKRAIKQAAMQQLLTGRTRLPGFGGEWETKRLGEIALFSKGRGLAKTDLSLDGRQRCLHYGELFTVYGERITEVLHGTDREGKFVYSMRNDVLMPTSDVTPSGLATASCILMSDIIIGGDILVIRASESVLNGEFLAHAIKTQRDQVMQLVSGTTVFHLYGRDMANFCFAVPPVLEQQAIAAILSDMDAEIAALEHRLDKTRAIKQGMMQQLLTGTIRLPIPNDDTEDDHAHDA